jgi:hypothetical protein
MQVRHQQGGGDSLAGNIVTRGTLLILLTLLMVIRFAAAATLYGTYQASASHTCADSSCTSAIDVITGTGSNTLQGASNFTANITEDSFYNPGNFQPGRIVITSLSDCPYKNVIAECNQSLP